MSTSEFPPASDLLGAETSARLEEVSLPQEAAQPLAEKSNRKLNRRLPMVLGVGGAVVGLVFAAVLVWILLPGPKRVPRTLSAAVAQASDEEPAETPRATQLTDLAAEFQPLPSALALVAETVAAQAQAFDNATLDGDTLAGLGRQGDLRQGAGEVKREEVPRAQRWEVRWPPSTTELYAKQLDFFGIELAAVGGGSSTVDFAFDLSKPRPEKRSLPAGNTEKRLYFAHRGNSKRLDVDRVLLTSAGVDTLNRIVLQFLPATAEEELAALERTFAGKRSVEDILKTVFGVRPGGKGYEFYVIDQRLRGEN